MTTKFLWCDTETTGLDPERDKLLELGFVVTDSELNALDSAEWVIGQSPADLARMDPYVSDMHTKNGLASEVLKVFEKGGFNIGRIQEAAIQFVTKHFPITEEDTEEEGVKPTLFGNTITFDVGFLKWYMPQLAALFHYRTCDVSAFKLPMQEWFGLTVSKTKSNHRVKDDLLNSIEELQAYRETMLGFDTEAPGVADLEEK